MHDDGIRHPVAAPLLLLVEEDQHDEHIDDDQVVDVLRQVPQNSFLVPDLCAVGSEHQQAHDFFAGSLAEVPLEEDVVAEDDNQGRQCREHPEDQYSTTYSGLSA